MALSEEERFIRFTRLKKALAPIHKKIRRNGGRYANVKVPIEMIENLENEMYTVLGPWKGWVRKENDNA